MLTISKVVKHLRIAADQIRLKLEDQQDSESDCAQPGPPTVVQASACSESFPTSKSEDVPPRGRTLKPEDKRLVIKAAAALQPGSKRSSVIIENKKTDAKPAVTKEVQRGMDFDWADEVAPMFEQVEAFRRMEVNEAQEVLVEPTTPAKRWDSPPKQSPTKQLEQLTLDIHSLQRLCELSQLSDDRLVDEVDYFYTKSSPKIKHKLASEPIFMSAEICEPGTFKASVKLKATKDLTSLKYSEWANEFRADYSLRDSETYQVRVSGFIKREENIFPNRLAKARFLLDMSMREDWAYGIHDITWQTIAHSDEPPTLTLKFFDRDKANLALQRGVVYEETHFDCSIITGGSLQCCYRCKFYGHESTTCTSPQVCPKCVGRHDRKPCEAANPKCFNCRGPHLTEDTVCPVRRKFEREKRFPTVAEVTKACKVAQNSKTSFRKDGAAKKSKSAAAKLDLDATQNSTSALPTPKARKATNQNPFPTTAQHRSNTSFSVNGDATASSEADSSTWPSHTDATKEDWAREEDLQDEDQDFGYEYKLRFSDRKRETGK